MLPRWPNIDIAASCIHALEPLDAFDELRLGPGSLDGLSGRLVPQQYFKPLSLNCTYLPFDCFTAAISGLRYSANALASSWLTTVGGASQSQNALTSIAEIIPVVNASR